MLNRIQPNPVNYSSHTAIKWPQAVGVVILAMVLLCGLGGCGKKPGQVDPPPGVSREDFPKVYPDPATDPS